MARRARPLAEDREQERALKVSEAGPSPVAQPRLARGYIQTIHPDTKLEVWFVPGEALPEWAPQAVEEG